MFVQLIWSSDTRSYIWCVCECAKKWIKIWKYETVHMKCAHQNSISGITPTLNRTRFWRADSPLVFSVNNVQITAQWSRRNETNKPQKMRMNMSKSVAYTQIHSTPPTTLSLSRCLLLHYKCNMSCFIHSNSKPYEILLLAIVCVRFLRSSDLRNRYNTTIWYMIIMTRDDDDGDDIRSTSTQKKKKKTKN